jgi:uncharacterized delta-60 repeat protein
MKLEPQQRTSVLFRATHAVRALFASALLIGISCAYAQVSVSGSGGEPDRDFGAFAANGQSGVFLFTDTTMSNVSSAGVQSNARPIFVGTCGVNPNEDICIARLLRDGTQLDSSFAVNGVARFNNTGQDYGYATTIDANDRIVIAGVCAGFACVLRYSANGTPDSGYGVAGRTNVPGMFRALVTVIDADGKLIVGGECYPSGVQHLCVARLTDSGAMDATFNGGNARSLVLGAASGQSVSALALDGAGNLLVSGYCSELLAAQPYARFCLARLLPNGDFDLSFNTNGFRVLALGSSTENYYSGGVAIAPDGRIVVSGSCLNASFIAVFCAVRLTVSGQLDSSFGVDGFAGLGYQKINDVPSPNDVKVYVDEAARLVLLGACPNGFCMARTLASGRPDPTFGANGMRLHRPDSANPTTEQRGGVFVRLDSNRVLHAGSCGTSTPGQFRGCVARYYLDTPPGERCSLDLDGDGLLSSHTDGVMWARVMLGFRGSNVTQNAIGALAVRNTSARIEAHLATHCGIR